MSFLARTFSQKMQRNDDVDSNDNNDDSDRTASDSVKDIKVKTFNFRIAYVFRQH